MKHLRLATLCFLFYLLMGFCFSVESSPERIVSLAPGFTEILYALGLDKEIIGTTSYCNYPDKAKMTEKVGDVLNPNVEKIVSLRPDLVFCGRYKWNLPEKLRVVGIPVEEIDDATSLKDILELILFIGDKVGKKDRAISLVSKLETQLERVRLRTAGLKSRKRVYLELDSGQWTIGGKSYLNEVLQSAGMINIFNDRSEAYLVVTVESIASRDPDLFISMWRTKQDYFKHPSWQVFRAVREKKVFDRSDMDWEALMRPGPRVFDGIEQLEKLLKDAFPEIQMQSGK